MGQSKLPIEPAEAARIARETRIARVTRVENLANQPMLQSAPTMKNFVTRKKLTFTITGLAALAGCFIAHFSLPSYGGTIEPLTAAQKQLAKQLRGHIEKLSSKIGARSLTKSPGGLERAAMYIEENFSAAGLKPSRQTFSVSGYLNDGLWGATHATQSTANILAEIAGTSKASEIIIIGAHYDAVQDCPGANDNGSGCVALIRAAQHLGQRVREGWQQIGRAHV